MKEEYEMEGNTMTDHDYHHHKTKDPANSRHLPLNLLEPIATSADNDNDVLLPSFVDLQRKTIQTLYHHGDMLVDDKSPKGSVDGPIRPLVDLINRHSSYCTLSSCSGRISLFDPNGRHEGIQGSTTADSNNNNNNNANNSGKGTGGWLLVSHHPIESSELEQCFPPVSAKDASTTTDDGSDDASAAASAAATIIPWIFKLEPLLLHVAANSLPRGRQLLQLALELGFRESGLVISDARVTVAIRGHSLALAVPLAPSGPLRPSNTNEFFLQALVTQANQRLIQNWYQLDRLYERIESNLFQVVVAAVTGDGGSGQVLSSIVTSIPSLNLWNLAAVAIPASIAKDKTAMDVLVFGGYGTGPDAPGNHTSYTTGRRSSDIYKLERRQNQWDTKWQRVVLDSPSQEEGANSTDTQQQLRMIQGLPDCQGMGACLLKSKNWIVLWGGRTNPKNALGKDLFVLIPNVTTTTSSSSTSTSTSSTRSYYSLGIPHDIRGTPPSPRWGHSLVALNNNTLLVVGGCNHEEGALDDIYALHFCDESSFVQWEKLSISLPTPRFHHMTMVQDESSIFVFGGLTSTTQVLEPFQSSNTTKQQQHDYIWVGQVERIDKNENGEMTTSLKVINEVESFREADLSGLNRFGAAACCCCCSSTESLVIVSGGIAASNENDDDDDESARPLDAYFLSTTINSTTSNTGKVTVAHVPILEYSAAKEEEENEVDFGSLVHHSAVAIDSNEFLLLGGGVNAFAFGNSFAKSYHVRIELPAAPAVSKSKKADTSFLDSSLQTKNSAMTFVVMVTPPTAKAVKAKLQAAGWLDKRYRMTKSTSSQSAHQQIAIPVTETGWNEIQNQLRWTTTTTTTTTEWQELILDHGQQEMPYSTSQFAAKKKKGKR
eukprot:scaffold1776_cov106-Cylindrotheca_fusiformis.AAC.1